MLGKKTPLSRLSAVAIKYLKEIEKRTQREIADLAGVSESFVSRVARNENAFTPAHIETIEKNLGHSVEYMLLRLRPRESFSEKDRNLYDRFLAVLKKMDEASHRT